MLCQVQVQYHELYGLSLNIQEVDPNYTLGERARLRAEIIKRLEAEGLYDMNRRHVLTLAPQRIAVISSPTAAGWGDFLDQLLMNPYRFRFDVQLFKAVMQGDAARDSICQALEIISKAAETFDAVVIIRGGGARIDLDCFDHYELAVSIAQFPLPVLTGIGHDRDETIADLVAHTRLKTPTAVAEFLVSNLRRYEEQLNALGDTVFGYASSLINEQQQHVAQLQNKLQVASKTHLIGQQKHLKQLGGSLGGNTRHRLKFGWEQIKSLQRILYSTADKALCQESSKISQLALTLQLQDPKRLMKKGYSITYLEGVALHKAKPPKPGQLLITHALNTIITSKVEDATTDTEQS